MQPISKFGVFLVVQWVRLTRLLAQLRGFALDFAESKKLLPYESVPGLWITTEKRL